MKPHISRLGFASASPFAPLVKVGGVLSGRWGRCIGGGAGLLILLLLAAGLAMFSLERPGDSVSGPQMVHIPRGYSAKRIGRLLESKGLVRSHLQFAWAAKAEGVSRKLQSGAFLVPSGMSPRALARYLAHAGSFQCRIVVPEGTTSKQIVSLFEQRGVSGVEDAENLMGDPSFTSGLGPAGSTLEGYLFPATYDYPPGTTARDLLVKMVERFKREAQGLELGLSEDLLKRQGLLPLAPHEVVVLASIVEREAGPAEEEPLVSRVFHNRLLRGMRLESCATVRYTINDWRRPLKPVDLRISSPYNTYRRTGLPAGAICNPGASALRAVLHPARGDWLYFVARGDGTNHFSLTYNDHLKAKRKYLGSP